MQIFILTIAELLNATCDLLELAGNDEYLTEAKGKLESRTLELINCAIELYQRKGENDARERNNIKSA
ncbi:MAG: hypothetical protein FWG06_03170 [Clostridiales bacterium]|nr:hypothetical protein [Clostridiales bacterium]